MYLPERHLVGSPVHTEAPTGQKSDVESCLMYLSKLFICLPRELVARTGAMVVVPDVEPKNWACSALSSNTISSMLTACPRAACHCCFGVAFN